MLSQQEMFEAIQQGLVTLEDFENWCSDLRSAAVEDAEFAASAYGQ